MNQSNKAIDELKKSLSDMESLYKSGIRVININNVISRIEGVIRVIDPKQLEIKCHICRVSQQEKNFYTENDSTYFCVKCSKGYFNHMIEGIDLTLKIFPPCRTIDQDNYIKSIEKDKIKYIQKLELLENE